MQIYLWSNEDYAQKISTENKLEEDQKAAVFINIHNTYEENIEAGIETPEPRGSFAMTLCENFLCLLTQDTFL